MGSCSLKVFFEVPDNIKVHQKGTPQSERLVVHNNSVLQLLLTSPDKCFNTLLGGPASISLLQVYLASPLTRNMHS
jgi:hypothetical protein